MKKLILILANLLIISQLAFSQAKPKAIVLNIDSQGFALDPTQAGNLVRLELDKTGVFEVVDKYDVRYLLEKNKLDVSNCYGKICLLEVAKILSSDKVLTGSMENFGQNIVLTLRVIDVKTEQIEKSQVMEFLNYPKELQTMIQITLQKLLGLPIDEMTLASLTKKNDYENTINNPYEKRLRLDGPRMGLTMFVGDKAEILQAKKNEGGFEVAPVMFQFGYQFETQYLNEGNFQALFEFIPTVTGTDQGLFIPSLTILNGFRHNKNGWEFALGPTFKLIAQAEGYYQDGKWIRKTETTPANIELETRVDSRGDLAISPGFVLACGKSFRSGKMNFPVNFYAVVPQKGTYQFGLSFGFNAKNR
jgi:hypothetical protein